MRLGRLLRFPARRALTPSPLAVGRRIAAMRDVSRVFQPWLALRRDLL